MSKKWTSDRIKFALTALLHAHNYDSALKQIGESAGALGSAFAREGLEAPTTYLAASKEEAHRRRHQTAPEGFKTIVIANDFHVPFHNVAGVQNWLDMCRDIQPDIIVINGDFLDCYTMSSFQQAPGMPKMQDEIDEGLVILEELRRNCPVADIHFTEGNHEERLRRIIKREHGLYGLRSFTLESLLEFDRLRIKFYQYGVIVKINELAVYHGEVVRGHAGYSARGELEKGGYKYMVTGHTHRLGWYNQKNRVRNNQALENGGLYDIKQCEYMMNPNWQNGHCVIFQGEGSTGDEITQINPVYMQYDGSFVWGGKLYTQG
jgi:predicted phosphodiesterase